MLYTDVNEFGWSVDNFGDVYVSFLTGVAGSAGSSANTKGTPVEMFSSAVVTEDVWEISLTLSATVTTTSTRRLLFDIMVDEAGGTAWVTRIPNLLVQQNDASVIPNTFRFPIAIKAGSSIAVRAQSNIASLAFRAAGRLRGKPSNPELVKVGYKVEAFGVDTTNTLGTAVTPGARTWGSWTSLGSSTQNNWWWQIGGIFTDTNMQQGFTALELSGGDASNKKTCIHECYLQALNGEQAGKEGTGSSAPIRKIASGETIYTRANTNLVTPDTGLYIAAYGVS